MLRRLLERFESTNRRYALLKKGDSVVVGVSGGPDSLALLRLLSVLSRKYALRLHAAHLDHDLQKTSAKTAALVRKAAEGLGLTFYLKKVDIRKSASRHRESLEDAGRRERYRFFEETAKKMGANKIATAHTLDDQAETVLMRLLRGAGLRGLSGIPYKRAQGKREIVRPLLDCSKKDLLLFLKKERISFVDDKMNRDPEFLRNRVRHQLLPLLCREYNPQIKQALSSLRSICRDAQNYLRDRSEISFRHCLKSAGPKRVSLDVRRLKKLHPALRHETLAVAVLRLKGSLTGFGYAHWEAADRLLGSDQKKPETHWPHRVRVQKTNGRLLISVR